MRWRIRWSVLIWVHNEMHPRTTESVHRRELELRPLYWAKRLMSCHRAGRPFPNSGKHLSIGPTPPCQSDYDLWHLQQWWRCVWWQRLAAQHGGVMAGDMAQYGR
jgi:hypothetical protein